MRAPGDLGDGEVRQGCREWEVCLIPLSQDEAVPAAGTAEPIKNQTA